MILATLRADGRGPCLGQSLLHLGFDPCCPSASAGLTVCLRSEAGTDDQICRFKQREERCLFCTFGTLCAS